MKQYKTPEIKIKNVALSDNISFLVSGGGDNGTQFNSNWDPGQDIVIDPKYWD